MVKTKIKIKSLLLFDFLVDDINDYRVLPENVSVKLVPGWGTFGFKFTLVIQTHRLEQIEDMPSSNLLQSLLDSGGDKMRKYFTRVDDLKSLPNTEQILRLESTDDIKNGLEMFFIK